MDKGKGILSSRYAIKLPGGGWISGGHTMRLAHERAAELGGVVMEFGCMFWREAVDKRRNEGKMKARGVGA